MPILCTLLPYKLLYFWPIEELPACQYLESKLACMCPWSVCTCISPSSQSNFTSYQTSFPELDKPLQDTMMLL